MRTAHGLVRSVEGIGESGWIRLGLAVAAMSAYILAFIPPFTPDEFRIVELAATPVVVFAWLFGFWGGAAAVIIIPFNAFLFSLVAGETFGTVMGQLQREDLLPAILLLVLGAALGGLRDVADQMRRESALRAGTEAARRQSEEAYAFVADAVSDGIVTIDDDRTILSANRAAAEIFGSRIRELVGRPIGSLMPERVRADHDAALRGYLDRVASGLADYLLQIAGLGEGDREITLEASFAAHVSQDRRVFTGVIRDVTERERPADTPIAAAMAALDAPSDPTILYIEDVPPGLDTIEEITASRPGMKLVRARRGQDGLELARDHVPDLILLDLNLPDMHGSEALRRIREDSLISRTPVIILGADAAGDQEAQLLDAGAQACLPTPLDAAKLLRTVDEVLGA